MGQKHAVKAYLTVEANIEQVAGKPKMRGAKVTRVHQNPPNDNKGIVLEVEIEVDEDLFLPHIFKVDTKTVEPSGDAPQMSVKPGGPRRKLRRG